MIGGFIFFHFPSLCLDWSVLKPNQPFANFVQERPRDPPFWILLEGENSGFFRLPSDLNLTSYVCLLPAKQLTGRLQASSLQQSLPRRSVATSAGCQALCFNCDPGIFAGIVEQRASRCAWRAVKRWSFFFSRLMSQAGAAGVHLYPRKLWFNH